MTSTQFSRPSQRERDQDDANATLNYNDDLFSSNPMYNRMVLDLGGKFLKTIMIFFKLIYGDRTETCGPITKKLTCAVYGIGSGGGAEPEIMDYTFPFVDFTTTDIASGSFQTGRPQIQPDFKTIQEAMLSLEINFDIVLMIWPFPSMSSDEKCSCKVLQVNQLEESPERQCLDGLEYYRAYSKIKYGSCKSDCVSLCDDLKTLKETLPKYSIIAYEQTSVSGSEELIKYIDDCENGFIRNEDDEETEEQTEYEIMSKKEFPSEKSREFLVYTIVLLRLRTRSTDTKVTV